MTGQIVAVERMEQDALRKEMDLSSLPPGLYSVYLKEQNNPSPKYNSLKLLKN